MRTRPGIVPNCRIPRRNPKSRVASVSAWFQTAIITSGRRSRIPGVTRQREIGRVSAMKVLLLGGTGNISAECAALLHARGYEVIVVTRGQRPVPQHYRSLVVSDCHDRAAMSVALHGIAPDVVVNFLGYELAHVQTDAELFRGRIRQYIFVSSATVYAKPHRQLPLTENAPVGNAFSAYAQKKLACEEWLRNRSELPVTIVRPSHTYSCRWFPNCVNSAGWTFAARLLGRRPVFVPDDGENPWTLTAAADFAVGLAGLVGLDRAVGEAFHITSDEALTWNQIYAETAAALGVENPVVEKIPTEWLCQRFPQLTAGLKGDKSNPGIFDNSKIKQFVPDFVCRIPFAKGIRASIAWYRDHPEEQITSEPTDALFDEVALAWREVPNRSL